MGTQAGERLSHAYLLSWCPYVVCYDLRPASVQISQELGLVQVMAMVPNTFNTVF